MNQHTSDHDYLQEIAALRTEHEAAIAVSGVESISQSFSSSAENDFHRSPSRLSPGHIFPLIPQDEYAVVSAEDCRKVYHVGIVSYYEGGRLARVKFTGQPLVGYKPGTVLEDAPGESAVRWVRDTDAVCPPGGRVYKREVLPDVRWVRHVRGKVSDFTHRSRLRCLQKMAMLDARTAVVPLFVTLTWHENWPDELSCKALLRAFLKRLGRSWAKCPVMWRLEWQRRGAPHFHLLVYLDLTDSALAEFRLWVARNWNELCYPWFQMIVSSGPFLPSDAQHLAFLLHHDAMHPEQDSVQRLRDHKGALAYCAKYVGKASDGGYQPGREVGRFWGVWHWDLQPVSLVRVVMAYDLAIKARRWLRKLGRRGVKPARRIGARRRRRLVADGIGPPGLRMTKYSWLWGAWSFCASTAAARMVAYLASLQGHTESPDQSEWTNPGLWCLPVPR